VLDPQIEIAGGRVATLNLGYDADGIEVEILTQPDFGRVTVAPDNSLAVVLTGTTGSGELTFDYKVTYADGTVEVHTAPLDVTAPTQDQGWGLGNHYLLEEDAEGDMAIEYGDNHRKVYVTGSEDALSRADIAKMEGLADSAITTEWLLAHPAYGGSEEMALDSGLANELWHALTNATSGPCSHWLLFEKGYTYTFGRTVHRGAGGEDPLHPMVISSWGEGAQPVLDSQIQIYQVYSSNIVFQDIELAEGVTVLDASNLIFDNVSFTDRGVVVQDIDGLTFRNCDFLDIIRDAPSSASGEWQPNADRLTGLYGADLDGVLIEGSFFDHIGWADGYDGSAKQGQPPSMFSHNLYFNNTAFDVTFHDNITMRAASMGALFRGGVYAEDNVFLDNNMAVQFLGGNYDGAGAIGNFSYFADNVITSGAHKQAELIGALTLGISNGGIDSTLLDNIVAHLADPNNAEEFSEKLFANAAVQNIKSAFYNDTLVYNWIGSRYDDYDALWRNAGANGISAADLNQITIQNFATDLLDDPAAAIADLADYLRLHTGPESTATAETAAAIIAFFQDGFGIAPEEDSTTTLHFVPSDLADGVRWDNGLNWTGGEVPEAGDTVLLDGNLVYYAGAGTNTVALLDLGPGGTFDIAAGKLTVTEELVLDETGEVDISFAGQFWLDGYDDTDLLDLDIAGGRFANTGQIQGGLDMQVTGGQALLGVGEAVFELTGGSRLEVNGSDAQIGFDGAAGESAALQLAADATLAFVADTRGIAAIEEFRSGALGETVSDVASSVSLGGATLDLDLSALTVTSGRFTLIEVDTLSGDFDAIEVTGLNGRAAALAVDYAEDSVTLLLGAAAALPGTGTEFVWHDLG